MLSYEQWKDQEGPETIRRCKKDMSVKPEYGHRQLFTAISRTCNCKPEL